VRPAPPAPILAITAALAAFLAGSAALRLPVASAAPVGQRFAEELARSDWRWTRTAVVPTAGGGYAVSAECDWGGSTLRFEALTPGRDGSVAIAVRPCVGYGAGPVWLLLTVGPGDRVTRHYCGRLPGGAAGAEDRSRAFAAALRHAFGR
jgi:hypothetical protein